MAENHANAGGGRLGHQTMSSLLKSKPPVPYANMLRQVTGHMKKLQAELEAEANTNVEFEESSRKSFEFLTGQIKALKKAINTLSDTLLEEIHHVSHTLSKEIDYCKHHPRITELEERVEKLENDFQDFMAETNTKFKILNEQDSICNVKIDRLNSDMDAVLNALPKVEEAMLKADSHLNEKTANLFLEVNKINDLLAVDRCKSNAGFDRLEARIKEMNIDFEDKIARSQRSLQQQIEYVMNRVDVLANFKNQHNNGAAAGDKENTTNNLNIRTPHEWMNKEKQDSTTKTENVLFNRTPKNEDNNFVGVSATERLFGSENPFGNSMSKRTF